MPDSKLTKDDLLEVQILSDPVYFAEIYLRSPSDPKKSLELRPYQRKILRSRSQKRVLRMGRRTGKSVTLAIEAIWKAFTYTDREILIVAGYDSQVQTLFNLINRMTKDAPEISSSIARTRMRPYEIWFKNNSVIQGYVGNNSVRGKCLPRDTQVVKENGTSVSIDKLKVGDEVLSIDLETEKSIVGTVEAIHDNGIKELYEVETASERFLVATANHKVMTMGRGWAEIQQLYTQEKVDREADFVSVVHPNGKAYWSRVKRVTKLSLKKRTFDLTVTPSHTFVAYKKNSNSKGAVAAGPSITSGQKIEEGLAPGGFLVHNSANDLYIDEVDSLTNEALVEAVLPISTTYKDTNLTISGTPTGKREYFYNIVKQQKDLGFDEYFFPSMVSPEWNKDRELELKAVTTVTQFEHEYLALFGTAAEGVFKNNFIDSNLYVYSYSSLRYNPENIYVLGVDWNESRFGVQAVVLEYMNIPDLLIPYNDGEWKTPDGELINKIEKSNALRVFYADAIDPADFTNMGSVEFILKLMKKIKFNKMVFDRGHGEANYEMLRLSLDKGEGPMGTKCTNMKYMLDNMASVDMGGSTEIIDKITGIARKTPTKNTMVKNLQLLNESGQLIIPAVDLKGNTVENEEFNLVGQMRGYIIDRVGRYGEVYASTVRDGLDHRLDATMLAAYGYMMDTSIFHKRDMDVVIDNVPGLELAFTKGGWRSNLEKIKDVPKVSSLSGALLYDHGFWSGEGEPPEYTLDKNGTPKKVGSRSVKSRGFSHKSRTLTRSTKGRSF
jgi:hypothetical protein